MAHENAKTRIFTGIFCSFLLIFLFPLLSYGADADGETNTMKLTSVDALCDQIADADEDLVIDWSDSSSDTEAITLSVPDGISVTIQGGSFSNLIVNGDGTLILDGVTVDAFDVSAPGILLENGTLCLTGKTNVSAADGTLAHPNGQTALAVLNDAVLLLKDAGTIDAGDGYSFTASDEKGGNGGIAMELEKDATIVASSLLKASGGDGGTGKTGGTGGDAFRMIPGATAAFLEDTQQMLFGGLGAKGTDGTRSNNGIRSEGLYRMHFRAANEGNAVASFSLESYDFTCSKLSCTAGFALQLEASTEDDGEDVLFAGWETNSGTRISEALICNILTPAQNTIYTAEFTYECGCTLDVKVQDLSVTMPYYNETYDVSLDDLITSVTRSGKCRLHDDTAKTQNNFSVTAIEIGQSSVKESDFDDYYSLSADGTLTLLRVSSTVYTLHISVMVSLPDGPSVTKDALVLVTLGEPMNTTLPEDRVTFDLSSQSDLAITPEWNGNTLVSIVGYHDTTNEQIVVNPDVSYYLSEDGKTIYLSSDLFSQLSSGDEVRFVFTFSAGEDQQLLVQIDRSYSNLFNLPKGVRPRILCILLIVTGALALYMRRRFGKE